MPTLSETPTYLGAKNPFVGLGSELYVRQEAGHYGEPYNTSGGFTNYHPFVCELLPGEIVSKVHTLIPSNYLSGSRSANSLTKGVLFSEGTFTFAFGYSHLFLFLRHLMGKVDWEGGTESSAVQYHYDTEATFTLSDQIDDIGQGSTSNPGSPDSGVLGIGLLQFIEAPTKQVAQRVIRYYSGMRVNSMTISVINSSTVALTSIGLIGKDVEELSGENTGSAPKPSNYPQNYTGFGLHQDVLFPSWKARLQLVDNSDNTAVELPFRNFILNINNNYYNDNLINNISGYSGSNFHAGLFKDFFKPGIREVQFSFELPLIGYDNSFLGTTKWIRNYFEGENFACRLMLTDEEATRKVEIDMTNCTFTAGDIESVPTGGISIPFTARAFPINGNDELTMNFTHIT